MKTEKNKEKKTDSFDWLVNGFMRGLLGRSDLKYVSVATQFRLLFMAMRTGLEANLTDSD